MELRNLIPLWRAALVSGGRAERTIDSYVDRLDDFAAFLGSAPPLSRVTQQTIEAYQRQLGRRLAPRTIALALTAIRSFCRFAVRAGLRQDDPTLQVDYPSLPRTLPRALPPEQVRALLAAIVEPDGLSAFEAFQWQRNRRAIYLMLYAGLRIGEVASLRRRDLIVERRVLTLRSAKGNKDRSVPIHQVLWGELRLVESFRSTDAVCGKRTGHGMSARSLEHIFERWVPRLQLGFKFVPHQLRHTCFTELIVRGANVFNVQAIAGHEDPKTTTLYYKLAAEHLREDIDRLPAIW